MHNAEWEKYRNILLRGGMGYRWVSRHVKELQDHFDDLRQQARSLGHDANTADACAAKQLGALPELAKNVIANTRPILLHRHPLLVATLLPALVYLLLCIVSAFGIFGVVYQVKAASGAAGPWLDLLVQLSVDMQTFVVLPLLGMIVARYCFRNRCPRRYWITGLVVLSLSGSAARIDIKLPDAARVQKSTIGIGLFYDVHKLPGFADGQSNLLRLLTNLLLCGAAFGYSIRCERQAMKGQRHAA